MSAAALALFSGHATRVHGSPTNGSRQMSVIDKIKSLFSGGSSAEAHDHSGHDHAEHDHAGHDHAGHDHAGHDHSHESAADPAPADPAGESRPT